MLDRTVIKKGLRRADIMKTPYGVGYTVYFYYDGYSDYDWKKGSCGCACDTGLTLEQAKRKAKYYVNKD